jgi:hypothetical protein
VVALPCEQADDPTPVPGSWPSEALMRPEPQSHDKRPATPVHNCSSKQWPFLMAMAEPHGRVSRRARPPGAAWTAVRTPRSPSLPTPAPTTPNRPCPRAETNAVLR